jgi:hypothetical protein
MPIGMSSSMLTASATGKGLLDEDDRVESSRDRRTIAASRVIEGRIVGDRRSDRRCSSAMLSVIEGRIVGDRRSDRRRSSAMLSVIGGQIVDARAPCCR